MIFSMEMVEVDRIWSVSKHQSNRISSTSSSPFARDCPSQTRGVVDTSGIFRIFVFAYVLHNGGLQTPPWVPSPSIVHESLCNSPCRFLSLIIRYHAIHHSFRGRRLLLLINSFIIWYMLYRIIIMIIAMLSSMFAMSLRSKTGKETILLKILLITRYNVYLSV